MRRPITIWTLGYGSRSKERVLSMLKANEVELVVDIRRWPTSKRGDFTRESLEAWLKEAGIGYLWMGDRLGGYRRGGFERYMESREFKRGIEELLRLASQRRTCLLCLEENPRSCHRRFVARYLQHLGVEVHHILR
ncbi:MAG: DUF488 domain-containing protein [Candidatus Nezhaarchaeota archaeon]|nr:DUF488 domain-containing protein [Candidatus Nezhaarchaeota archaeon]